MSKKIVLIISIIVLIAAAVVIILLMRGNEDTWLCQNGQWVMHGNPSAPMPTSGCGTATPTPSVTTATPSPSTASEIMVTSPQANAQVHSPIEISGSARGSWYFEAVFPIRLLDANGNEIGRAQAQAQGDWTTNDFVPFTAELTYSLSATSNGFLVFNNDNPSGLQQNSKEFRVPVIISPSQ